MQTADMQHMQHKKKGCKGSHLWCVQPSGLSLSVAGDEIWVADSESSTVRSCELDSGAGRPHVGGDKLFSDNLFRFGDRYAQVGLSLNL